MIANKPTLQQRLRRCSGRRPWRALFAMCALIALSYPSLAPAQANPPQTELDVASYESELSRITEAIKHSEGIPQSLKSLPRNWRVRVGDKTVEVSTAWLAAD